MPLMMCLGSDDLCAVLHRFSNDHLLNVWFSNLYQTAQIEVCIRRQHTSHVPEHVLGDKDGCGVCALPGESWEVGGPRSDRLFMGYNYEGGYRIWNALATYYGGTVPVLPDHGSTAEVQRDAKGFKLCIRRKYYLDTRHQHLYPHHSMRMTSARTTTRSMECQQPSCYHPRAQQLKQ